MCVCVCVCLQPVREQKEGESEVKESEEKEVKEEEKKEEEQVIPQEASVLSTLKLNKKMKMVVCHVTLLDGSQFSCEVEVRHIHPSVCLSVYISGWML